jgi:hypothetical protein
MKSLFLALVVASASASATAADAPTFNGKWQLHQNIADNESDQACTFTQKDNDLTGSCSSDKGSVNITGKVDDKKVTWVYKSEYNGSPITLTYKGTLDSSDRIAGTVSVEEYSVDGEFTATRAK